MDKNKIFCIGTQVWFSACNDKNKIWLGIDLTSTGYKLRFVNEKELFNRYPENIREDFSVGLGPMYSKIYNSLTDEQKILLSNGEVVEV